MLLLFSSSIASPSSNNNKYSDIEGVFEGVTVMLTLGVVDMLGVNDTDGVTDSLGVIETDGVTEIEGVTDTLGVVLTATYKILKDFVSVLVGTVRLVTVTVVVQISPEGRFVIVNALPEEVLDILLE
jgi:hypothetical protein